MQNTKIKDVSARVLLTPMPENGIDQFTFLRPIGTLNPQKVEALLQLGDILDPLDLLRSLNKLVSAFIANGEKDLMPEDMLALEKTISYIADSWEVERGTFVPINKSFAIKQE